VDCEYLARVCAKSIRKWMHFFIYGSKIRYGNPMDDVSAVDWLLQFAQGNPGPDAQNGPTFLLYQIHNIYNAGILIFHMRKTEMWLVHKAKNTVTCTHSCLFGFARVLHPKKLPKIFESNQSINCDELGINRRNNPPKIYFLKFRQFSFRK
jgi:hypothetical protein